MYVSRDCCSGPQPALSQVFCGLEACVDGREEPEEALRCGGGEPASRAARLFGFSWCRIVKIDVRVLRNRQASFW